MKVRLLALLAVPLALSLASGCDSKDGGDSGKGGAAKKADAKAGDAKGGDAKAGDAKAGDTKAADTKEAAGKAGDEGGGGGDALTLEEAKREKFKKNAAELKKVLTAARQKSAHGDWAAAVEEYKKAVKLDDDNAHILGELGWAHFNAKNLDQAEHYIRLALRYEQKTERRADMLYKLGRVEEERGDYTSAKKHYDHSLELSENAETRKHDEAVGDKAAAACAGGKCTKPDYETLDKACEAMLARVHEQLGLKAHSADDEFTCDPSKAQKITLEGGDASEAVILSITGEHAGVGEEEYDLLAHIEGGWHWVGTLLDVENPHHGGISRTGEVESLEAKELVPESPGTEILVHLAFAETDVDFEDNIIYHDEHEAWVVCGVNKGVHNCHEIPTRLFYEAESLDPDAPTPHDLTTHEFKATAEFDGKGNVTVTGEGELPKDFVGTHAIAKLPEPKGFVFLHDD